MGHRSEILGLLRSQLQHSLPKQHVFPLLRILWLAHLRRRLDRLRFDVLFKGSHIATSETDRNSAGLINHIFKSCVFMLLILYRLLLVRRCASIQLQGYMWLPCSGDLGSARHGLHSCRRTLEVFSVKLRAIVGCSPLSLPSFLH